MRKLFTAPAIHFKGGGWGGSRSQIKRSYRTTFDGDASTGQGETKTEEIGPAISKDAPRDSSLFDK